jgi:hypothetical protein
MDSALAPAKRGMNKYRENLADLWNIAGISAGDDWPAVNGVVAANQPYITAHYGFLLVDYYLLPGLSGQQTHIEKGTLSFNPPFSPSCATPFEYPLLLAGVTGTVACSANTYTVSVAFGSLQLPAGGLSVNGHACAQAVSLAGGESVSWT